jgi:hypothetical protein
VVSHLCKIAFSTNHNFISCFPNIHMYEEVHISCQFDQEVYTMIGDSKTHNEYKYCESFLQCTTKIVEKLQQFFLRNQ